MTRRAVIAIGGNSLIKDQSRREVDDQLAAVQETAGHIADFIRLGHEAVITHGNGPQVGFILRRSELAFEAGELHFVPLINCVADTQGAIGYQIQESLTNAFRERGIDRHPASLVTLVEVDGGDPSFDHPTKPIGVVYPPEKVPELQRRHPDWHLRAQPGKGFQRVVPSPRPLRIIEMEAISAMLDSGLVVVAAGGGGIPVVRNANGNLAGVNAVVDKDLTSALLATQIGADLLVISTLVENVYRDFDQPIRRPLGRITADEARGLMVRGEFAAGSMRPKVAAALEFIENGGREVVITTPENIVRAVTGNRGTRIVP